MTPANYNEQDYVMQEQVVIRQILTQAQPYPQAERYGDHIGQHGGKSNAGQLKGLVLRTPPDGRCHFPAQVHSPSETECRKSPKESGSERQYYYSNLVPIRQPQYKLEHTSFPLPGVNEYQPHERDSDQKGHGKPMNSLVWTTLIPKYASRNQHIEYRPSLKEDGDDRHIRVFSGEHEERRVEVPDDRQRERKVRHVAPIAHFAKGKQAFPYQPPAFRVEDQGPSEQQEKGGIPSYQADPPEQVYHEWVVTARGDDQRRKGKGDDSQHHHWQCQLMAIG